MVDIRQEFINQAKQLTRNAEVLQDEAYARQVRAGIPLGYAGSAEDCAAAALLLCSEEGKYITGIDLMVDGGMHL